jgi:hypothetical protein
VVVIRLSIPMFSTPMPSAFAKLYDRKTPITAAQILNDRVVPFYDEHGIQLSRMLTGKGRCRAHQSAVGGSRRRDNTSGRHKTAPGDAELGLTPKRADRFNGAVPAASLGSATGFQE